MWRMWGGEGGSRSGSVLRDGVTALMEAVRRGLAGAMGDGSAQGGWIGTMPRPRRPLLGNPGSLGSQTAVSLSLKGEGDRDGEEMGRGGAGQADIFWTGGRGVWSSQTRFGKEGQVSGVEPGLR